MKLFFDNKKAQKEILKAVDDLLHDLESYKMLAKIAYSPDTPKETRDYAHCSMKVISLQIRALKHEIKEALK